MTAVGGAIGAAIGSWLSRPNQSNQNKRNIASKILDEYSKRIKKEKGTLTKEEIDVIIYNLEEIKKSLD